jgi:hypothetical protein
VRNSYKESLYISSLPSLQELERSRNIAHVQHWINVSGIDINQIYPKQALSPYTISQFEFADVFTDGKKLTDFSALESINTEHYESVSELEHRNAFLAAIKVLILQLSDERSTRIFCHRGLARSPLVAAAALNHIHDESLAQSIARVHQIHPPAYFTDISISALLWCEQQLHKTA